MKEYLNLHNLVFNTPHLITPEYGETVLAVLGDRLGIDPSAYSISSTEKEQRDVNVTGNGTYVLPILGSMVHRASSLDALSGIQSYQSIKARIQEALDDPKVKNILLEIDSPGGTVAGAFDLRDFIMEAKGQKPIYAVANDTMASAAYLIGSAATKVYATQTASVGSIGVVAMHVDQSEANRKAGVKPTFIYAGDYKVAGNPHEPLEGDKLAYLQESVNDSYEMFVNAVAEARGVDPQVIRDTEARVYRGEKAAELGLIDGVQSFDATLEELATVSPKRVSFNMSMKESFDMDKELMEKLEADYAQVSADLEKTKGNLEKITAAVIAEGYTITAEGLQKAKEPEMIEVAGVMTDKASLPEHVLVALEEAAAKEADRDLTIRASETFPNLKLDASKAILTAIESMEEDKQKAVLEAVKVADAALAEKFEEVGETKVETGMETAKEQLESLIEDYAEEHNVPRHKATAEVMKTEQGKQLYKEAKKETN